MQTNPLALFGDHLARLRKARGWSQEKLALESGLARSYVSGIERGRRNVALVNICVLADTLGVPTSEMLRFAQAAGNAEDAAVASERTPLPQISRSLCKLENRDQVWLAEIIRSLSSRLSHAAPPSATSAYAQSSHGAASVGAHEDAFDGDTPDRSGDLDAGSPVRHQTSSASPTRYPAISDASSEANVTHADAQASEVSRRIADPDRRQDGEMDRSPGPAAAPGTNVVAQENPLRWPARREEHE
ncbi:helix-hairpin-helix DNA-binding motif-containing protein [Pandoraea anapnoica]|uniref:Helix-hairpin-helix DNA-binding motif-containing protein n=1 Tax=Pandoraea anapnoica TaxID=2508301 RepID=A0A5E4ZHE8_9BURK|nr:helix-turn-helix domain-containing protein [Pandoraea anapnoica]VVE60248.1 helix-hairpin-helix DNA-binding motif-containing protein [Pandoraea anapnoica]